MDPLTSSHWSRIDALFSALEGVADAERDRRLAEVGGSDPELAATVRGMLANAGAGGRLHQVIEAAAGALATPATPFPPRFGGYRTVREIGRGGMGVVYEGVSDDEFARRVAIKMAPLARVGAAADARFRLERQILSSLDHPHIARFLDGGAEGDLPYLVMEFVEGEPITSYVARKALPLAGRLRLVGKLCQALHYAHQRLVVHRDLKPSNILVTDDGTPKLLDFGIAKLLDAGDAPALTIGATAWTPDYASPEQVTGELVGTPSDIYSLGLVLYEVLTGARAQVTDTTSPLALSRSVCEVDPPLPSDRVASTGDRQLARRLIGDLDTIAMTAMHKDPARRYASAAALADDIERYLNGLPVEARAGSLWYRLRKGLVRHRGAVAAAALVAMAVVGGLVSTAYQARRADRRFQQVRALANEFVFGVHDRIAALPGSTEARRALVQTALTYLENLREDAAGDPGLAKELAAAYQRVGRVQGDPLAANLGDPAAAAVSYARALELLTPLEASGDAAARLTLAHVELQFAHLRRAQGDAVGSDAKFAHARELADRQRAERPDDDATLELVGEVYAAISRAANSRPDAETAAAAAARALEAAEALVARHPADANRRDNVATAQGAMAAAHVARGQLDLAAVSFRKAAEIREALVAADPTNTDLRRGLVISLGNLGDVLGGRSGENLGDYAGAAVALERAVAISRENAAADPKDRRAAFDLVNGLLRLGSALAELPQRDGEAVSHLEEADRVNARLIADEPGSARYRLSQLVIDRRLGRLHRLAGRDAEAERRLARLRRDAVGMYDGPSAASARLQFASAGVELVSLWAARDDSRALAAATLARDEIGAATMPPMMQAQARFDLAQAFLRLSARPGHPGVADAALAELDLSAAVWREAVLPQALVAQRARALTDIARVRKDAEGLAHR